MRRAARELHLSLGVDPLHASVLSAAVLDHRTDGSEPPARVRSLVASRVDGERRVFGELWRMMSEAPRATVVVRSRQQVDALRDLQSRHAGVCSGVDLMRRLRGGRLVVLQADVVEPRTEPGYEPVEALSLAAGIGVELPADLSPRALGLLHAAALRDPSAENRLALAKYHRQLCLASAAVMDLLLGLGHPPSTLCQRPAATADAESVREGEGGQSVPATPGTGGLPVLVPGGGDRNPAVPLATCMRVALGAVQVPAMHGDLERYRVLEGELPLVGADAFAPAAGGGFVLAHGLRRDAPWMEAAIQTVERGLRLGWWSGRPWLASRPLLLVGPPGTGKSRLAREISRLARVPMSAVDLGMASDALGVAGVARGWASATPCLPARAICDHGVANPIIVCDELDKAGGHRGTGGVIHDALLGMLEPGTAQAFEDRCLQVELDVSACVWIFTANGVEELPAPLLSRLDVVEVGRPGAEHFDVLFAAIGRDLARHWGISSAFMPDLPVGVVDGLRRLFDRHRSARRLAADVTRLLAAAVPDRPEVLH